MPRWAIELYVDTPDGREWLDPSAASALTRPDGGGATLDAVADLVDGSHRKEAGVYFLDSGEDGGSYAEDTWYELEVTWTYAGEARTAYRRVYYRGEGTAVDGASALSVANDGDGDAVTATVTGTAGVTYQLLYRKSAASSWTEGESRVGSGEIAQTGLDNDTWYRFCIVGVSGDVYSLPSDVVGLYVTDGSTEATGDMALAMENYRTLLASSATWQAWVGATGTEPERIATAKTFIHFCGTKIDRTLTTDAQKVAAWQAKRPFAIVTQDDDWAQVKRGEGGPFTASGSLLCYIEDDVEIADKDNIEEPWIPFANKLDDVLKDMEALAGTDGYIRVQSFALAVPPRRADRGLVPTQGDHQLAVLSVMWR